MFAAHFCRSEVCSDELEPFFWNPTGVLAPEAVEGFREIRLPRLAALVESAMDLLDHRIHVIGMNESRPVPVPESTFDTLDKTSCALIKSKEEALKLRPTVTWNRCVRDLRPVSGLDCRQQAFAFKTPL